MSYSELDMRTSTRLSAKFVKRPRHDDEGTGNATEGRSLSLASATKRPRDATAAVTAGVPQPMSVPLEPPRVYVATRSEMLAFFSLLGTLQILAYFIAVKYVIIHAHRSEAPVRGAITSSNYVGLTVTLRANKSTTIERTVIKFTTHDEYEASWLWTDSRWKTSMVKVTRFESPSAYLFL